MICKNCGNEIPEGLSECFICGENNTIETKNNNDMIKKSDTSNLITREEYKKYKRQFYISLCSIPVLLLFLFGIYVFYDKAIGIIFTLICTYVGVTEMIKLYKKVKAGKQLYG